MRVSAGAAGAASGEQVARVPLISVSAEQRCRARCLVLRPTPFGPPLPFARSHG